MRIKRSRARVRSIKDEPRDMTPEALAHAAVAKAVHEVGPDGKVRLVVTVSLKTTDAERLSAMAIKRSRNLDTLVSEILERYVGRRPSRE